MDQQAKNTLFSIEKLLSQLVGKQTVKMVSQTQFLEHATNEILKAQSESQEASHARLSALYKSVLYTSAAIEDTESTTLQVPIFVIEQSTFAEQSNELYTPEQADALNPPDKTVFENDSLVKAMSKMSSLFDSVQKMAGELEEEDDDDVEKTDVAKSEEKEVIWPDDLNEIPKDQALQF